MTGIRFTFWVTVIAVLTSGVVAPIPGLSDLPSLSDIFKAGVEETTPEPTATNEVEKNASASAATAGAFAFDKGIHLGSPKIGSLDANLNVAASKSFGVSKGISTDSQAPAEIILFPIPERSPEVLRLPPPLPPTPCPTQQGPPTRQYFNVHNPNNRPRF